MAELATVARPYAEALFRVAQNGDLAAWSALVEELAQIGANPDLQAYAGNPKVTHDQLNETVASLVKSPLGAEARNLIAMLAENGRIGLLPEIGTQFTALKNAYQGAADATVYSAFALSDDQLHTLAASLEKKFGRKLNPTVELDPSLIGGVRVVVGDEVLDTSVRAKLQQMHAALVA